MASVRLIPRIGLTLCFYSFVERSKSGPDCLEV
jgi:hypothetical protein